MKSVSVHRLLILLCGILFALVVVLTNAHRADAVNACGAAGVTCPYIKVTGGDVFAGGWYAPNCPGTSYQNYQGGQPANPNEGGILTYATENGLSPTGGSSGQYGVFALGSVEGNDAADYGFASGSSFGGSNRSQLTFANTNLPSGGTAWGGQFEGTTPQAHCIPDYYGTKIGANPVAYNSTVLNDVNTLTDGKNTSANPGGSMFVIHGGMVLGSKSLFVQGNVYIDGPITYGSHNAASAPKFALVVQGNIYIDGSVKQLDGWYIAEPAASSSPSTNDGVIWTCHDNSTTPTIDSSYLLNACNQNSLTVNGALTAKHVNFTRIVGDVSGGPAETINYSPEMIINGPFFNDTSSYNLDGLVSLPPIL